MIRLFSSPKASRSSLQRWIEWMIQSEAIGEWSEAESIAVSRWLE